MTNALEIDGLAYAYPDGHQALFGVNLNIATGERVALLGPNGAGKTTLVMHLNGILHGGVGAVRVNEMIVNPKDKATIKEIRRRVGVVFQDPDDQLFMPTAWDDVAFGPKNLGLTGTELDERVDSALAAVRMTEFAQRPPHHLSFGQRRRVALASVLAMQPEVLVLDEPSSNLDPASRRELADILRSLNLTVLMVTHDLPFAYEICPRSVILAGGVITADSTTDEILSNAELMEANRLELPFGFDLASARAAISGRR